MSHLASLHGDKDQTLDDMDETKCGGLNGRSSA